jgi:hypothetical protein
MLKLTRDWYLALAVITGGVIYSLPLSAQSPASTEIRACVHNGNSQLRLLAAGQTCAPNERLVVWNTSGPKGDKGDTGATGPLGPQGLQGIAGPQGPQGLQGIPGIAGPEGPAGKNGRDGIDGRDGLPGNVGPQGPPGIDGRDGLDGRPGNVGPQGPAGRDGKDGAPGNVGPQGPPGIDGRDGLPGNVGPQGLPGKPGPPGNTGPRGFTGDQGAPGETGPAGAGTGAIIGLINPDQCGISTFDARLIVARILGTNLVVPVVRQPSGIKFPKKTIPYYPFQFYGVPPGRWSIQVGTLSGPVEDDGTGNLTAYPEFQSMNFIANVLVADGSITNVGTINLDRQCAAEPTEVCGNGIDENGNGFIDENCPAIFDQVPPPPVCDDLGLEQCNDGTCRIAGNCPVAYVPPGNGSGNSSGNTTVPGPIPEPAPEPGPSNGAASSDAPRDIYLGSDRRW